MMSTRKQTETGTKGRCSVLRNNKGFTLIELAIVLVIIGLILGSVLKGKDLINSAKQKQFYNAFVKTWELVIVSYYDRTGYLLGDGNGTTSGPNNGGVYGSPNGQFDFINDGEFTAVDAAIKRVGLQVPETNTGNSYQSSFTGAYSGSTIISLRLYAPNPAYLPNDNSMLLLNVPIDLAYALDKLIDGQVDSTAGKCLLLGTSPANTWGDASSGGTVSLGMKIDVP